MSTGKIPYETSVIVLGEELGFGQKVVVQLELQGPNPGSISLWTSLTSLCFIFLVYRQRGVGLTLQARGEG